jgi:predicted GIY-YIG superfamily endonuclease
MGLAEILRSSQMGGVSRDYWVYIVRCRDGEYCTGVTSNVDRRVAQHNLGTDEGAYTFKRRPVVLVYASVFRTPDEAIFMEKRIQGWSRAKKEALIRGDWAALQVLARSVAHASTSSA